MDHSAAGPVMKPANYIPLYITTVELAGLVGMSYRTVQAWRLKSGNPSKGPDFTLFGGVAMYLAEDVQAWLIATGRGHLVPKLHALLAKKQEA